MRKIEIKGKKFDYDESSKAVVLKAEITSKVLSAVRRYPKGGEGRDWKVVVPHRGKAVWWVIDLKNGISYVVQRHFFDKRNYVKEIDRYRVW